MYIDAMQQIYSNVTKIVVDSKQGSNLLYLPLDKLIKMTGQVSEEVATGGQASAPPISSPNSTSAAVDVRARDASRARTRETR